MAEAMSDTDRLDRAVQSLRNMIRDKKALNRLLMGEEESSDEELRQAIVCALIDWNVTPPLITPVTLSNHPNKYLLLMGAAVQALTSSGIWHSREHMPSSDGGSSADDHAKAGEYSGWIERYAAEYERKKVDLKAALNIAAAYGDMGVTSEYGVLSLGSNIYGVLW